MTLVDGGLLNDCDSVGHTYSPLNVVVVGIL